MVDRCSRNRIADRLIDRNAFSGQRRFIYSAGARKNNAVYRNILSGAHHEHVAFFNLLDGQRYLLFAADHSGRLRRKLHETLQRISRLPFCVCLQHLADRDERKNHGSGLKIKPVHIVHDGDRVSIQLRARHRKQRIGAPDKGCRRSERDKRIHVRCAMRQTSKAADKEFLIDDHHDNRKQHLRKSHRNVVILKKCRQRPSQHHVTHGDIHQDKQKAERRNQASFQLRRLRIA